MTRYHDTPTKKAKLVIMQQKRPSGAVATVNFTSGITHLVENRAQVLLRTLQKSGTVWSYS